MATYKTGTELQTWANSLTEGDTISNANALLWINEFLTAKLAGDAMIKETQNYGDSNELSWYDLPSDYELAYKVEEYAANTFGDGDYCRLYGEYDIDDEYIRFRTAGHYKLAYFRAPDEIAALADNVKIDKCFYLACATWLAYRFLTNDDEDNAIQQSLGELRRKEFNDEMAIAVQRRMQRFRVKRTIRR